MKLDPLLGARGVLLEPTTVVAKAWEHIERIGSRAVFAPRSVLVTGAGPIGLLAALLGAQRGLDVHVLDRASDGPEARLVDALGATYHCGSVGEPDVHADVVIEATGAPPVIVRRRSATRRRTAIVCLTGVSSARARDRPSTPARWNRAMVLENDVVFGSVNANLRHYRAAATALAAADPQWLDALITRRVRARRTSRRR